MRIDEKQLAEFARRGMVAQAKVAELGAGPRRTASPAAIDAGRVVDQVVFRSKLEARFWSEVLSPLLAGRALLFCEYEPLKLRVGYRCWYTPDFLAISRVALAPNAQLLRQVVIAGAELAGGGDPRPLVLEVKGYWRDDARAKVAAAAARHRWLRFAAVTWDRRARVWNVDAVAAR